jgi:hypothetical protein
VPKTPARRGSSDAELGAKILAGWEHLARAVPDGPRYNRRLAEHFGVEVREIQHVRDIRNGVAHPGEPIGRQDLERALAIIRRAKRGRARTPAPRRAAPADAPRTRKSAASKSTRGTSTRASARRGPTQREPARGESSRRGAGRSGSTAPQPARRGSARGGSTRRGSSRRAWPGPAWREAVRRQSTRDGRRRNKITYVEETTRLGQIGQRLRWIWSRVADYWIALAVVLLGVPSAIVGAVHLGPVGLLVGPLVAAGAVAVLAAAAWLLVMAAVVVAVVVAGAAVLAAVILILHGDYLEGLAILGVLAVLGAAYVAWDFG